MSLNNKAIRAPMNNRCFTSGGFADHGSHVDVLTAAAVVHCTKGIFRTNYPITAQIDLSALTVLDKDGNANTLKTAPAIAADGATVTKAYILACNGTTAYIIEPETDNASGTNNLDELVCPEGYAPFGAIKIVRTAGAAAFTLGTTDKTIANTTCTYTSLSVCPPLVSDLT